jgi:metal-dependent amidase/aminoacylase/carboxypeptidase family protein
MNQPPLQGLPAKLVISLEELAPEACRLSDFFASRPEPSGREYVACSFHADFLHRYGFDTKTGICGFETAFFARKKWGTGDPVVTLLAEYDALPKIGHGCGHNLAGVMSSLAAATIVRCREFENAELRVLGTPCEEDGDAKAVMTDRGLFDDTDIALMIHPAPGFTTVTFRSTAYSVREITFREPLTRTDASETGLLPAEALDSFRLKLLSFHDESCPATVSPACFEDGVESFSAPGMAKGRFAFFSARRKFLDDFLGKVHEMADAEIRRLGLLLSWKTVGADLSEFLPNKTAEKHMLKIFRKLDLSQYSSPMLQGSADVGNVSRACPVVHPMLDVTGKKLPWHSQEFADATTRPKAHEALVIGAAALSLFVTEFALSKSFRQAVDEEHSSRRH